MFNSKKITISAGAFALALLGACSDDNSTAGATVDPDVIAQDDSTSSTKPASSSATQGNENGSTVIKFTSKPSSTIDLSNGSISVYDEENGASGECIADDKSYASMIQVREGDKQEVLMSLEIEKISDNCDDLYKEFEIECESKKGDFTEIEKNCKKGNFSVQCHYTSDKSDSFKSVYDEFFAKTSKACSELTEGAESAYGRYETPSSASKGNEDVAPTSSSSDDPIDIPPEDIDKYTQNPSDIGEVDVPSTGIAVPTLSNYTAQFTDDPAELSFDSHVLAYKGRASCSAINDGESIIKTESEMDPHIYAIAADKIGECFPATAEAAKNVDYKFKESCNYYIATSSDGMQPTGHTITKVSKDAIEFTSVHTGGSCMLSLQFFDVMYLIEDCDNLISKSTKTTSKSFTSTTWACEEGSYSPSKEAAAYGEWFRDDLIFP